MRLFGDKLLLKLNASSTSSGNLQLHTEKIDRKARHLLPFSCISLVAEQLTVLTSHHPRSLSKRLLGFIENPQIQYETTNLVSGFQLELFEGKGQVLYNQFNPVFSRSLSKFDDNPLQTNIEQTLMNYIIVVYDESDINEKSNLLAFLLMTVMFYQQEIIPIIRRINMNDIEQRKRLAKTDMDFCTALYRRWDDPKSITPGNTLFTENLNTSKNFDSYQI